MEVFGQIINQQIVLCRPLTWLIIGILTENNVLKHIYLKVDQFNCIMIYNSQTGLFFIIGSHNSNLKFGYNNHKVIYQQ